MVVLRNDYSHCPLKKRPLSACYDLIGEQTEPQDLSLKCAKEPDSVDSPDLCTKDHLYPQETRIQCYIPKESCENSNFNFSQRIPSLNKGDKDSNTCSARENACARTLCGGESSPVVCQKLGTSSHRQLTQAKRPVDNRTPISKKHIPFITPPSDEPTCSKSRGAGEDCISSQHIVKSKELRQQIVSHVEKRRHISEGNEKSIAYAAPVITSSLSLCSQSNFSQRLTHERERILMSVPPPVELTYPPCTPAGGLQHRKTTVTLSEAASNFRPACSSSNTSTPHRPWLVEGPSRCHSKTVPDNEKIPVGHVPPPPPPRSLLVNPSAFWGRVVPYPWSVPPVIVTSQPPSSRKQHERECCSPGSESASSDGSSGSVRNDARYSCAECNKTYSTYSGLSKHKQFHCAALGTKSFACKHCEKVYTSLGALKMHIRTHTLPCKCPLCGKAFSRPWLLQGHIRTHTGEKPFQCPQCDRCFADRSNLRAHLQTHADIKKYACNTCHKTFSRMSLLNKHAEVACPSIQRRSLQ
ncbi:Snai2p [Halocaridina rubra]|uniref:Snai2p n=1 Tax=Halocaridina rubra TaxID=373956 RepID=A0AAN8WW73_HALRR